MRELWKNNSLTIVMGALFVVFLGGQSVSGWLRHNEEQGEHSAPAIGYGEYLTSGEFLEGVFENWESEFLQMGSFVFLAAFLRQRGSAESKELEAHPDPDPRQAKTPESPGPVLRGGLALKVYSYSMSLAFLGLFLFSFAMHAVNGLRMQNQEAVLHHRPQETLLGYVTGSQFWFESFQNWQSEFLAVAAIVVLSIFLRQKDSPESKAVHEPHAKTGR